MIRPSKNQIESSDKNIEDSTGANPNCLRELSVMAAQKFTGSPAVPVAGKSTVKRRKRQTKEPKRGDFASDDEYMARYMEWRHFRSFQQKSVARSRAKAKRAEYEQELEIRATEHDNAMLEARVSELERDISLFIDMIKEQQEADSHIVPNQEDTQIVPSVAV